MEITNTSQINSTEFTNQDYTPQDGLLLNSLVVNKEFGLPEDKIEVHVMSPNGEMINSIYDFRNYTTRNILEDTSLYNTVELDPKSDLESLGLYSGQYDITYFFYRQLFLSSEASKFYISEISSDRTEIKVSNNNVSYNELGQSYLNFIATRNSRAFYSDFILNFGNNKTYIAVNVALDNVNTTQPSLYIKLYEPLPSNFKLKDDFWLVENISEPHSFRVNTEFIAESISDSTPLRGPNINIELAERTNLTTPYLNLSNLIDSSVSSSYQQLQSLIDEKGIDITVDYNDFNNFVHFSSARERLENFQYKLSQIQSLQSDIDSLSNLSPLTGQGYITVSKDNLQKQLNTLIEKLDGYEYFLYYESGSNAWPKTNSTKPYINDVKTSINVKNWLGSTDEYSQYYGGKLLEASNYDINNRNYIWNSLPEYIKEDTQNSNLELFVSMLGQHYDYIWIYAKDITDLSVADNRIDFGISKDLVADTLRNFGIKLYTNSRGQDDIYLSLLGVDQNSATLPSTGSYLIENYVTSSQYTIPNNDIVKETYKRIYHNLPYLLKTKGTKTGLRALINCFGIPETILKVKEYGGNRKDQNTIEQYNEKFNYALNLSSQGSNPVSLSFPLAPSYKQYLDTTYTDISADTIEFRFKLNTTLPTQSLLEGTNKYIKVTHTSGENANIEFRLSGSRGWSISPSINLPLYNNDWWTINLTRETGSVRQSNDEFNNTYTLNIGNKDTYGIHTLKSCSLEIDGNLSSSYNYNWEDTLTIGANQYYPFSGSIQELRYWIGSIPQINFIDHILNPTSISFNNETGSYNNLILRLPFGAELDNILTSSIHPSNTSSFYNVGTPNSNITVNNISYVTYTDNHESFLVNTPNVGTITQVDQKIRISEPNLIPGNVLSPFISIQKPEENPYTTDLSIVDVTLSPQDSINDDIISQLGSFNIDEYIGDPRISSLNNYPSLDALRQFYFKKYSSSQNVFDVIKLLNYFDNSLFKMIKDFVPARTNLSTGLTIKSNILERNKIARHEPALTFVDYSGSIETAFMSGSNGLNLNLNVDHTTSTNYISGSLVKNQTDGGALFNGELGGTELVVHTQTSDNISYEFNHIPLVSTVDIYNDFYRLPINPTLNNVLGARTSKRYLDVDYAYNPITPVNFNYLTSSLFTNVTSSDYPFLQSTVQDSNYTLKRHINPRYEGSKITSAKYNTFTPGDISYGSTATIDINPIKFAYFKEITSQSLTLNGRSNVNIKYLIDSASNVTELTEANKNLFDIQDIFNRVDANISLDDINKPSKQKALNGLKGIYAGGFRYEPIYQNYSKTSVTSHTTLKFNYQIDIPVENPDPSSTISQTLPIIDGLRGLEIIGSPTVGVSSTALNYDSSQLTTTLNSNIAFSVKRNTAFSGKIYQKITGNITLSVKISPPNLVASLYNGSSVLLGTYAIPIDFTSTKELNPPIPWDVVAKVKSPIGTTGYFYNNYNQPSVTSQLTGNDSIRNIPDLSTSQGVDAIRFIANSVSAYFSVTNVKNPFTTNTNKVTYGSVTPNNTYPVETQDGLVLEVTYPIEGLLVMQAGEGVNGETITKNLLTLSEIDGKLESSIICYKTALSPNIRFNTAPSTLPSILTNNLPYYLTSAPSMLYITGTLDNGFNPSPTDDNNWYFEVGQNPNNQYFNYLTASFDLSSQYYNYINVDPDTDDYHPITQQLPSTITGIGYEPINDLFLPKKGDLIRLYNYDKDSFVFNWVYEREIVNILPPSSTPIGTGYDGTGSYENRLVFELSGKGIDGSSLNPNIDSYPKTTGGIGKITNFIFLSKSPDETNVIINHDKREGVTSTGILFPSNISEDLKAQAGGIVKDLKSQNLI